jgi:uncharacterized cupin superfamily protein
MTIVIRGMGLGEVDTGSTIVAFGIARDLEAGESINDALINAGIDQLFVIDFTDRRKMKPHEYKKYKRLADVMRMGLVTFTEERGGYKISRMQIPRKVAPVKKAA